MHPVEPCLLTLPVINQFSWSAWQMEVCCTQNQSSNSSQYYVYTPTGSQTASGKPTITSITQTSQFFPDIGTQFNGISQGASYGDDWQMSTNYPIISLTNGSNVYYCRTFNWNSTGVEKGSLADNCQFTLPAGLPIGTHSLVVTANGIAFRPVSQFCTSALLTSTLTGTGYLQQHIIQLCSGNGSTATFTWTRAAVCGY